MAGHLQKLQYYLKNMTIIAILKMKYNLYIINIIFFSSDASPQRNNDNVFTLHI
jgi:hypothetical protein